MELEKFIEGFEEDNDGQFSEHTVSDLTEIYNNHNGEMTPGHAKELYFVYRLFIG